MQAKNSKEGYILIVEDDRGISELEAQSLAPMGKEIRRAYTAEETIAAIRQQQPDLMLLDYKLDDANAMELLDKVRASGLETPPFLIVTGRGDEAVAVESMKAGAQDYLVKDSYFLKNLLPATSKALEKAEILRELDRTKRAAEAEHRKYQELFTFAPVPYMALCDKGRIREVNRAWLKAFGYKAEEVQGRPAADLLAEESRAAFNKEFQLFLAKGLLEGLDLTLLTGGGDRRRVVFSGRLVTDADGGFGRAQCAFNDITDRLEDERRLKGLSRMYNLLARVNQVASQEKTSDSLLRSVCTTLVSVGGFPLAWAAALDAESGAVRPLVSAGLNARCPEDVIAATGGPSTAYAGLSAAARNGRISRVADIAADPAAAPWRAKALAAGFRALTVMPLRRGRAVPYALAFFSAGPGAFSPEELDLLTEIQDDISLALESMESESRRAAAQSALNATADSLALLLDNNPVIMFTLRNDGKTYPCLRIGGSVARVLGYEPHEALLPGWFRGNVHPEDRKAAKESQAALAKPGRSEAEFRFRRKDGTYAWIAARFLVPRDGGDIQGSWTDITFQRECEGRFEVLAGACGAGVVGVSRDGTVAYVNALAAKMLGGAKPSQLRGSRAETLASGTGRTSPLAAVLKKALAGEQPVKAAVLTGGLQAEALPCPRCGGALLLLRK